ncbi:MAG: phospholipase [Inquilinus sp.]|nr:phospholipase [Inquilinus sp.]
MPATIGSISLYMGPHHLGGPDDLERVVIDFVDGARSTLDIAVQELESEPIAEAIIGARQRGVRVRMVLEGDYLIAHQPLDDPFTPAGRHEPNRFLFNALLRAKIDVRTDYNPAIFHQKFIVRDIAGTRAALLTGSTNFTPTGTDSNLNHLVVIDGKSVAGEYADEFAEIWSGTFGTKRERHERKPREPRVAGVKLKPIFAPDHQPEMEIMKQMLKARTRVDFAIFTFAQSSGVDDAMIALARGGIAVRGIADARQGNQAWAASRPLAAAGVEFYLASRGAGLNKLHHKLMVIDGQVLVVGSFNYTEPANLLNDENILVIGDLEETRPESIARQQALGTYALTEIDRMIGAHGRRLT